MNLTIVTCQGGEDDTTFESFTLAHPDTLTEFGLSELIQRCEEKLVEHYESYPCMPDEPPLADNLGKMVDEVYKEYMLAMHAYKDQKAAWKPMSVQGLLREQGVFFLEELPTGFRLEFLGHYTHKSSIPSSSSFSLWGLPYRDRDLALYAFDDEEQDSTASYS